MTTYKSRKRIPLTALALTMTLGVLLAVAFPAFASDSDSTVTAASMPTVAVVPVQVIYVAENQPVQIVDSQGKLLEVIYLKKKP